MFATIMDKAISWGNQLRSIMFSTVMDKAISWSYQLHSIIFSPFKARAISWGSERQRELAQAVIVPLRNGLVSFKTISEMLISVNQSSVLPGSKAYDDIRTEIVNMKEQLEKSEQVASTALKQLDGETERLTVEYSKLSDQKKQKLAELQRLKTQLESHTASLNVYIQALETEERNLKSAEDTVRNMRERRDRAETVRNVGLVFLLIPLIGTIPGAVMAGIGHFEMNQATDAVKRAQKEIQNCTSKVTLYSNKVSEYKPLICHQESYIKKVDNKIHATEAKRQDVSVKWKAIADFQEKIRHAVHQLGLLCVVGNTAEVHTRYVILLQPMMRIMDNMITALEKMAGDNLLHTSDIKSLMLDIKTNQSTLQNSHRQICNTNGHFVDDYC